MGVRCNTSNVSTRMLGIKGPKGDSGDQGLPGNDGLGVPAGGNPEDVLKKVSADDNDTYWGEPTLVSPWQIVTTNYISINKDNIVGDTTNGSFHIILPNSPLPGNFIRIKTTTSILHNLTVVRNGEFIMSESEDYIIDGNYLDITFIYINSNIGWIT